MATVRIIWNEPKMRNIEYSPDGAVGRMLRRRERDYITATRITTPVLTGRLKASVRHIGIERVRNGIELRVGSLAPYAQYVHEGTRPHIIRPRGRGPKGRLRFQVVGKTVYARSVLHPGTKANPFLTKWIRLFTAR